MRAARCAGACSSALALASCPCLNGLATHKLAGAGSSLLNVDVGVEAGRTLTSTPFHSLYGLPSSGSLLPTSATYTCAFAEHSHMVHEC